MRSARAVAIAALLAVTAACSDKRDVLAPAIRPNTLLQPGPVGIGSDPIIVQYYAQFVEITAGMNHTCARRRNGRVYCWGMDDADQVGIDRASAETCENAVYQCVTRPTYISASGFTTATRVSAGGRTTCALDSSGKMWCWGDASRHNFGLGPSSLGSTTPIQAAGGMVFQSLGVGPSNVCGTSSGSMFCWGEAAALGGLTLFPTQVTTAGIPIHFDSVSVQGGTACGQSWNGSSYDVNCWGSNTTGSVGVDTSLHIVLPFARPAIQSAGVATAGSFTCVDRIDGTVACFGDNTQGELGNSYFTGALTSAPQTVGWNLYLRSAPQLHGVATGIGGTACALDPNGAAYCWGAPNALGSNTNRAIARTPLAVQGGLTFRAIAVAQNHACAIGTDNHIYCWGLNWAGQLGLGYSSDGVVTTPMQAVDPVN